MKTPGSSPGIEGNSLRRLILLLGQRPMTCTEIGETMWGGKKNRQAYARPAGKLVAVARRQGLVIESPLRRKVGDARKYQLKHNTEPSRQPVAKT